MQLTRVPGCQLWFWSTSCGGLRTPAPSEIHLPVSHNHCNSTESNKCFLLDLLLSPLPFPSYSFYLRASARYCDYSLCVCVCSSVCKITHKVVMDVHQLDRHGQQVSHKMWLNFGDDPIPDVNPGSLSTFLNITRYGRHFTIYSDL